MLLNKNKLILSSLLACILSAFLTSFFVKNMPMTNTKIYIMMIIEVIVLTLCIQLVFSFVKINILKYRFINIIFFYIVNIMIFVLIKNFLYTDLNNDEVDTSEYWYHVLPIVIVTILLMLVGYVLYYFATNITLKCHNYFFNIYAAIGSLVYSYTTVLLNVFSGDPYHINAYIHPIYNVYYNTPYSSTSYSIYGHYELFYKPFLKIFGTSPYVIMVIVLFLSFITAFLLTRVVYKLVSNTVIRLLFPIALIAPTGVLFDSVSYMTTPHRLIWGSIILTYAIKTNKGKYYYIVGYLLTALSLVWNTESGLVYIIVWSVYCLFDKLDINIKSVIRRISFCLVGIVLSILLGLVFVNTYNLIVGGGVFVKHFFYPIINDNFVENYVTDIKFGNYIYIYCLYSALAILIYCAYSLIKNKVLKEEHIVILMNSMIVFGLELYYIIRPVYFAILIVYPFTLMNIAYLAEKGICRWNKIFDFRHNLLNRIVSIMMFIVLGFLSLISCGIPGKFAERYDEKRYTRETIDDELEWLKNTVPENAYAFGWGVDEWYGYLERPITYTMVGTTDVLLDIKANQNVYDKLEKEANESQYVFTQAFSFSKFHILNINYVMTDRNYLINDSYALFETREYQSSKKDSISSFHNEGSIKIFCFDDILNDNGYLSISGYAIDDSLDWSEENDNIKIGLLDKESGEVIISDTSCVSRPDVNDAYKEKDYTYSGFYSRIDSTEFDSSIEYEIVIMFKNEDSFNYIKTGYYVNNANDTEV